MKALSTVGAGHCGASRSRVTPWVATDSKRTLLRNRRAQHFTVCTSLSADADAHTLPAVTELLISTPSHQQLGQVLAAEPEPEPEWAPTSRAGTLGLGPKPGAFSQGMLPGHA